MEDMKEFHDTHDSMSSWLSAKERMLTVLGPISSDSRMVQSQVQQVQVLREEFRTQQPQLQHLVDVGDSVLGYLDPRSPEGQKVNNKLKHIQERWADLLGKTLSALCVCMEILNFTVLKSQMLWCSVWCVCKLLFRPGISDNCDVWEAKLYKNLLRKVRYVIGAWMYGRKTEAKRISIVRSVLSGYLLLLLHILYVLFYHRICKMSPHLYLY